MKDFIMERVTIEVTYKCSLKCRLCANYVPYKSDTAQHYFSVENWCKVIDRYFEIVDYVKIFVVSGGEPCLYPDLPVLLKHLKIYDKRIGLVHVVTNGTVIPSQNILDSVKDFGEKIYFIVDNYGSKISTKIEAIDEQMTKQGIWHEIRNYTEDNPHCGGWGDFGGLTEKRSKNQGEAEEVFAKCAISSKIHFCFPISGARMWPCDAVMRRTELGFPCDQSEYIDLLDSTLSIEEQRGKIRAIYAKKSLSACAYCGGLCEDSERFVPGEQLTNEEMQYVRAGAKSYSDVLAMMSKKNSTESNFDA